MKPNFLILGFLLVFAALVFADASEHYVRPWQNESWLTGSQYARALASISMTSSSDIANMDDAQLASYSSLLDRTLLDFSTNLDQLELQKLKTEHVPEDNVEVDLDNAIKWKHYADEIDVAWGEVSPATFFKEEWDIWNYPQNWENCVDDSLSALEESAKTVNQYRKNVLDERAVFEHAGLCNENYTRKNSKYCTDAIEDIQCNSSGMYNQLPDFTWYPACIRNHWATAASLNATLGEMVAAYADAEDECASGIGKAESAKENAEAKLDNYSKDMLDSVYESGSSEESSGASGIKGAYEDLSAIKTDSDAILKTARDAENGKGEGRLYNCIQMRAEATAGYGKITGSRLVEEAAVVVAQSHDDAYSALDMLSSKTDKLTTAGYDLYMNAKSECNLGDSATQLGLKYTHYQNCSADANRALQSLAGIAITNAQMGMNFSDMETLLQKAEKDGIDVTYEREEFEVIKANLITVSTSAQLENLRQRIIDKAQDKYGNLPGWRDMLRAYILNAKPDYDYLYSWFEDDSCYSASVSMYECAIGNLAEMRASYADIEAELTQAHGGDLVASSLLVDSEERWTAAVLDQPGDAYLYVTIVNPLGFGADNVAVTVPASLNYRKIDLVEGAGDVLIVSSSDGKAEIHLANVSAYEKIYLVFKKEDTPCSTLSSSEMAWGDTSGGARVEKTVQISCVHDVESLDVGVRDATSVSLDGVWVEPSEGIVSREVKTGAHALKIESYDYDAYAATRESGFVNTVGQKTSVEFFINFEPNRDMETLSYLVMESGKDIQNVKVFGYSGEKISDVSVMGGNAISFKVEKLDAGKEATVRIDYDISNAKEYVNSSIAYYETQPLTSDEAALLDSAETLAAAGDYDSALMKIDELVAKMKQTDSDYAKLLLKHNKLEEEIGQKIAMIKDALRVAQELGVDNGVVAELQARLAELNRASNMTVARGSLTDPLDTFDMNWEGKELTKISKELADGEKTVKDGWIASGATDPTLSALIDEIEKQNNQFDGTKRFDDAMHAYYALALGEAAIDGAKQNATLKATQDKARFGQALQNANDALALYKKEYDEASGTHWAGLFPETASDISKKLNALNSRKDYAQAAIDAEAIESRINGTLDSLKAQEESMRENAQSLYGGLKAGMDSQDSSVIESALRAADSDANQKQYVAAMKNLETAVTKMGSLKKKDDGLLIIAITGLLVLGVVALYMYRGHIPKNILPPEKGKEREYKRLKREP